MKSKLITTLQFLLISVLLVSCNFMSKKGKWSQADIEKFHSEMESTPEVAMLKGTPEGDFFISCYLEKLQANYSSFAKADSDEAGCVKYAEECATEAFSQIQNSSGSVKGNWTDDDYFDFYDELLLSSDLDFIGDFKEEFVDCYVYKIEQNFSSPYDVEYGANSDAILEGLAGECFEELGFN